ncbi:MAG TPA: YaiO family outer membrane beta-barrel protein [Thermoanaerobaculia bacterium]
MKYVVILCLLAMPAAAQIASPDPSHSTTAELLYGHSSLRGGGHWQSADLALTTLLPQTVGYFFLHASERPEEKGSLAALAATHDWNSRFFTYAAAAGALQRASFLPTSRFDLELNAKLLQDRRLVASIGGTIARYPTRHRDDVLSIGATYYAPLIVTYRYFHNTSSPGHVESHAQLLQIGLERRGRISTYLRHSWGNEAYQLTNLVTPQNVALSGHTTTFAVRRWITGRSGFTAEIEQQSKASDFRRFGGRVGAFYAF